MSAYDPLRTLAYKLTVPVSEKNISLVLLRKAFFE
jgi:hypothetical protein